MEVCSSQACPTPVAIDQGGPILVLGPGRRPCADVGQEASVLCVRPRRPVEMLAVWVQTEEEGRVKKELGRGRVLE